MYTLKTSWLKNPGQSENNAYRVKFISNDLVTGQFPGQFTKKARDQDSWSNEKTRWRRT